MSRAKVQRHRKIKSLIQKRKSEIVLWRIW